MQRHICISQIENTSLFDFVIIGGGATGLGAAVDACSRGYKTLLLEQSDFAAGTSSRSTKLVHGGVRYLKQGNLTLVHEGLVERERMLHNAPHLVHVLPFIIPTHGKWEKFYYGSGLKLYDALRGKSVFPASHPLDKDEATQLVGNLNTKHFPGAVFYSDGQFDDARMALELAQTVNSLGGVAINHFKVHTIEKAPSGQRRIIADDIVNGTSHTIHTRAVINATGIFSLNFQQGVSPDQHTRLALSRGTHLVFDKLFLKGPAAIMVPKTEDGRVIFAIPWQGHTLVGTTDVPQESPTMCPQPTRAEIDYLLRYLPGLLKKAPGRGDILCAFAGIRPLAGQVGHANTAKISREHAISHDGIGTVCITGGKWTSYRRMGEDVINFAARLHKLPGKRSMSKQLKIHNYVPQKASGIFASYGAAAPMLDELNRRETTSLSAGELPLTAAQVRYAVREEMALTLEDVLARRTRCLFLNVKQTLEVAPQVATIMAGELSAGQSWIEEQIKNFNRFASSFLPPSP